MTLLPPNATSSELSIEATTARISDVPVPNAGIWNPDTCPVDLLPWFAWALSVDNWNPNWPEAIKRQVIKSSFAVHQTKGTVGALQLALEALQLDGVEVAEWFQYAGNPYTFRVDVELKTRGLSEAEIAEIEQVINRAKNVRSHLDGLRIWLTTESSAPLVGTLALVGEVIEILPHSITEQTAEIAVSVHGAAATIAETVTVNPSGA